MNRIEVRPGDVVVSNFTGYQHWALVTDGLCPLGEPMLISATERNGTVREESWRSVTQGNETHVADIKHTMPIAEVLARARSQIGKWTYGLPKRNCEEFVKWSLGLKVSSLQVKAGITGAVVGAALVGALAENPRFITFLGGTVILAGLAVFLARAPKRKPSVSDSNIPANA